MKIICNNCGAMVNETDAVCPICGAHTVHAPLPDDKKLWEQTPENKTEVPPCPPEGESCANSAPGAGTKSTPRTIKPIQKRAMSKVTVLLLVVIILLLIVIAWLMMRTANNPAAPKEQISEQQVDSQASQPRVVVRQITGAEADSIMKMHMAEMERMEQLMEEMMGEDPFAEFDRFAEDMGGNWEEVPQRNVQKPKQSTPTKIRLAGRVGNDQYVMVLNAADQSNIKGTAAKVVKGKEQEALHLLGIGSGSDLTVTIYDRKNNPVGTLSGTYNGYTYSGIFTTQSTQAPFQLTIQ